MQFVEQLTSLIIELVRFKVITPALTTNCMYVRRSVFNLKYLLTDAFSCSMDKRVGFYASQRSRKCENSI